MGIREELTRAELDGEAIESRLFHGQCETCGCFDYLDLEEHSQCSDCVQTARDYAETEESLMHWGKM